jgi:hypothetical protein
VAFRCIRRATLPATFFRGSFSVPIDVDRIVSALKAVQGVLTTLAAYTDWKTDDKLAEVLSIVLTNQSLIDLIKQLVGDNDVVSNTGAARSAAILSAADSYAAICPNCKSDSEASGIPWALLLEYLPTIIRLILTFTGKR